MTAQAYAATVSDINDFYSELDSAVTNGGGELELLVGGTLPAPTTIYVTSSVTVTIRADAANPVTLYPDSGASYTRHMLFDIASGETLTLQFENVTLDGGGIAGGMTVTGGGSLKLDGADIRNCYQYNSGGGIRAAGDVEIANSTLAGNTTAQHGGGVYTSVGNVTVSNSLLEENQADGSENNSGGGIYAAAGGVAITESEFFGNTACGVTNVWGGGVCAAGDAGTVTIQDSTFEGNIATATNTSYGKASGGGVYAGGGGSIAGSTFQDNEVQATGPTGGGVFLKSNASNTATITGSTFAGNKVTSGNGNSYGGGFYAEYGDLEITGSEFLENTSTATSTGMTMGGGVCVKNGSVTVNGQSAFMGNRAVAGEDCAYGGGISTINNGNVTVSDGCIFAENIAEGTAYGYGGGVRTSYGTITILDSQFTENEAMAAGGGYGGGACTEYGNVYVERSVVQDNAVNSSSGVISAGSYGAGVCARSNYYGGGIVTIIGSTFRANTATNTAGSAYGGGAYAYETVAISDSTFTDNAVTAFDSNSGAYRGAYGGAVCTGVADNTGTVTITDGSTVQGNTATNTVGSVYGGGLFTGCNVVIGDSTLADNTATGTAAYGGGIYLQASASLSSSGGNTFTGNYATTEGGALYSGSYGGDYDNLPATAYQVLTLDTSDQFGDNAATALYEPPADASVTYANLNTASVSQFTHPLNNYDINYAGGTECFLVTYDANGGSGGPYEDTAYAGTAYTVLTNSAAGITRSSYTFQTWNTEADGSGTSYAAGDSMSITADLTLYAQWSYNGGGGGGGSTTYSVTYNANGGTGSHKDSGISSGTSYSILSGTDTGIAYSGYTLRGWNSKADGTGTSYAVGDTVTIRSSLTLYAVWTAGEDDGYLHVTYYPNGATSGDVPVDSTRYNSGDTVTVLYNTGLLRRSGYYFSGWSLTETGGTVLRPGTQIIIGDANVQLYARWSVSSAGGSLETLYDTEVPLAALTTDHIWYIQGYPDNSVKPDGNLTRAEAAAIFYRLIDDASGKAQTDYAITFSDVTQGNWYYHEVAYLTNHGILFGYEDGTFHGDAQISRAEFAAIASRFDALLLGTDNTFSDVSESHWAVQYINSAAEKGWLTGYADGTFRPDQSISRAEAVTLINRVLDRSLTADNEPDGLHSYIDLDRTYWAYYDIMEASHTHEYDRNDAQEEVWTTYSYAHG
ncbi:MAG: InlB B-repeat-containing protein [Oscillospiraceae bacterium]|nr:InlB B-repeat-containing protein [Oscillospiraceae bacterium]